MRKIYTVLVIILMCLAGILPSRAFAAVSNEDATARYSKIINCYRNYIIRRDDKEGALEDLLVKLSYELNIDLDSNDDEKAYELECSFEILVYEPGAKLGYALYDINKDGVPELFILTEDHTILAIYSLIDDAPVLVGAYWSRNRCAMDKTGTLYIHASSGASDSYSASYSFSSGGELNLTEMVGVESFDEQGNAFPEPQYYRIVNGKKLIVNEEEAVSAWRKFPDVYSDNPTKDAGLNFVPFS